MTTDMKDRALRLIEQEDRRTQQDAQRRAEQARKGAEAEAEKLAVERYELEQRIEVEAMALNRSLHELDALHQRQGDTLRHAGRPLGHGHGLADLITPWWRARFGGFNSLTGTPSPHFNAEDKPLPERDALSRDHG